MEVDIKPLKRAFHHNCENIHCVVYSRSGTNDLKTCHRSTHSEKNDTRPCDLNSYRPISNLSFLSKTIERVVAARFNEHVESHNLLPSRQSAYRAHPSTKTAVIDVHNRIVRNVDRGGHVSVLVLLDLSSAFDAVDHSILLEVLANRFGVAGIALDWFRSYLDGRTQTLYVGAHQSATFVVHCSVPQGSVLGALKFICHTEDLPAVIAQYAIDHYLYADTQLSDEPPITSVAASIVNIDKCVSKLCTYGARASGFN